MVEIILELILNFIYIDVIFYYLVPQTVSYGKQIDDLNKQIKNLNEQIKKQNIKDDIKVIEKEKKIK
jgi:hypothetical protein